MNDPRLVGAALGGIVKVWESVQTQVLQKRTAAIEREVAHTPKIGTRECTCPVCGTGTLRILRDDVYYAATCENGCGQASVLR